MVFFAACILPPEDSLDEPGEIPGSNNLAGALNNIYNYMSPGVQFGVLPYLEIIYQARPDFAEGEEIWGWTYLLTGEDETAFNIWSKCNQEHLDVCAGMTFYYTNQLDNAKVIQYGELIIAKSPSWQFGDETLQKYSVARYTDSPHINYFDICVLLAEAYYLSGDAVMSLTYLRMVDKSIDLQSDDPALAYRLPDIISEYLDQYVYNFGND